MDELHTTRRGFLIRGMITAATANVASSGNSAFADETALDERESRFKILLNQNWKYSQGEFFNDPKETIEYLKSQARFKHFSLVDVPKFAVILHDARPDYFLARLGIGQQGLGRLRSWGPVAQRAVGADGVVHTSPALDEYLRFEQRVEYFAIQELISELAVKALDVAVLPGRTRFDEQGLHLDTLQPFPHALRCELRTIVAANVVRHAATDE